MATDSFHSEKSSYREALVEHIFTAEVMKHFWAKRDALVEIAKPQVDYAGYDLILEANGIIRHVQLKSTHKASRLGQIELPLALRDKPSGCVVIVRFDETTLEIGPFHFFGGLAGEPLPDISAFRVARRKLRNRDGVRTERPAVRCIPLSKFTELGTLDALLTQLFQRRAA